MSIFSLPSELLLQILTQLSYRELAGLMLVSRPLHDTIIDLVSLNFLARPHKGTASIPQVFFDLGTNIRYTGELAPVPDLVYVEGESTILAARKVARDPQVCAEGPSPGRTSLTHVDGSN